MWRQFREFFWPILDDDGPRPRDIEPSVMETVAKTKAATIEPMLLEATRAYEEERLRRQTVEGKAAQMATFNTLIVTVAIGVASLFYSDGVQTTLLGFVGMAIMMIMLIYLVKSIWFSMKALERAAFHVVTVEDVLKTATADVNSFKKSMIQEYVRCTKLNYQTINSKVDNMVMSQEFFKRAIVTLTLEGLWIGGFYLGPTIYSFWSSLVCLLCPALQ